MNFSQIIHVIAVIILPLLFAITLHEAAHGWIANKFGDKTALMMGRVTLNPLKHIDLFGTIILPIALLILSKFSFAFGWAKPVPVNWQNLRNPRRDMAFVAVAGPGANLVMAFFWAIIAKLSLMSLGTTTSSLVQAMTKYFYVAGIYGISINIILMALNLIPIPPLDGSRVIASILPPRIAARYNLIEPYGIWILLILIVFGFLSKILLPPVNYLVTLIRGLLGV